MKIKKYPADENLEKQILGEAILNKNSLTTIMSMLSNDCFYDKKNSIIFRAIASLYDKDQPVDIITVNEWVKKNNLQDRFDGNCAYYLSDLSNLSISNIDFHCKILIEFYLRRRQIDVFSEKINKCYDETVDVFDSLTDINNEVLKLTEFATKGKDSDIRELVMANLKRIESAAKGEVYGIKTGYSDIDNVLNGLKKGNLLIIAGRPGMGKTAFALNLAHNLAVNQNKPIGFFSLEMSGEELVARLTTINANIDSDLIKKGALSTNQREKIIESSGVIGDSPIYINDAAGLDIRELRSLASIMKKKYNIEALFVDYLQLISSTQYKGNRREEVDEIARKLKIIAKELDIPVIALAQLSRGVESRADKRPILSDLRESGEIEQSADIVMMLFRPEYYEIREVAMPNGLMQSTDNLAFVSVQKNRDGSTGDYPMYFFGKTQKFEDLNTNSLNNIRYKELKDLPF